MSAVTKTYLTENDILKRRYKETSFQNLFIFKLEPLFFHFLFFSIRIATMYAAQHVEKLTEERERSGVCVGVCVWEGGVARMKPLIYFIRLFLSLA